MVYVFFILTIISIAGLLLGLIKPQKAIFWKDNKKTRLKAAGIYFGATIMFFILTGITGEALVDDTQINDGQANPGKVVQYSVDKTDSSANQVTLRIVLSERYGQDTLVEIARKERTARDWSENFVCFFSIGVYSSSIAWARVAYLPGCPSCPNDKDRDGKDVEFVQQGMSREKADKVSHLALDSIPGKSLIAEYIDDINECKCQFYKVNDNKFIKVQLWNESEKDILFYELRTVSGIERYYGSTDGNIDMDNDDYWTFLNGIGTLHEEGRETLKYKLL